MAHIERSIEITKPVGSVYQQWAELEEFPRFLEGLKEVGFPGAHLNWRAEVLTFAPRGGGTRVTLRIDYDAVGPEVEDALRFVARRVQHDLELFRTLVHGGAPAAGSWSWIHPTREPSHA